MSIITHNCYISNRHSEPDLEGAEGNLLCNTKKKKKMNQSDLHVRGGIVMNLQALLDFDPVVRNVLTLCSS